MARIFHYDHTVGGRGKGNNVRRVGKDRDGLKGRGRGRRRRSGPTKGRGQMGRRELPPFSMSHEKALGLELGLGLGGEHDAQ